MLEGMSNKIVVDQSVFQYNNLVDGAILFYLRQVSTVKNIDMSYNNITGMALASFLIYFNGVNGNINHDFLINA